MHKIFGASPCGVEAAGGSDELLLGSSSPGFWELMPVTLDLSGPRLYLGMTCSVHRCIAHLTSDVGVHDYNNYYSLL